ncbi:hypothetical protein ACFQPG_08325 [Sphingomonas sp. GCM10030256]|uniref:hypothetical protein n=1 Tax=Sphingomonas sp. GCM10030256 TaxID=3273427 RepID=UPI0036100D7B
MNRFALLLPMVLAGCASASDAPSLAPRPAEAIDPRLPVEDRSGSIPASADLGAQLAMLVQQARAAEGRFDAAMAAAERLAATAGARQSESWIAAQQALSGAIAERAPVTRALADVDALGTALVNSRGGVSPADEAQLAAAADAIGTIDRRQHQRVAAAQGRL